MKRILFFLFLAGAATASITAMPRTQQDACQLAEQYFTSHSSVLRAPAAPAVMQHVWTAAQEDGAPAFYVFNRGEDGGFIIISAEDRTRTVLGYSDHGHFDEASMPDNMREWLEGYSRAIHYAAGLPERSGKQLRKSRLETKGAYTPVAPICQTKWGQADPYNLSCPEKNGERCVTGCVATAAAQIMAFHRWPNQGQGSHSYTWQRGEGDNVPLSVDFSSATYNWSLIDNEYSVASEQSHREEVAKLMYHCGVACEMVYGLSGEGGSWAYYYKMMHAFLDNFRYDAGLRILRKDYMGEQAFLDSVYLDLQKGWPVYFSGQTITNSGHAFVCDGIDQDGLVHINWGWYGSYDTYFPVSALDPEDQGIGGSDYAYTERVVAYKNIHPRTTDIPSYSFSSWQLQFEQTRFPRSTNLHYVADTLENDGLSTWQGTSVLLVYKNGELYQALTGSNSYSLQSLYCYFHFNTYVSLAGLEAGTYEIMPAMSVTGQPGVYEPIYVYGKGAVRLPMTVTSDSVFIGDAEQPAEPLRYDATENDYVEDFDSYELNSDFATKGYGWLTAEKSANGATVQLLVILPQGATTLVPGSYSVDTAAYYQSVYAGTGVDAEGYIHGSFVGYRSSDGKLTVPIWFVVSGTMTVSDEGVVSLNARNSAGRTIRCRLGASLQPIELVEESGAATRKQLRNGQLLLLAPDSRVYDAQGKRIE